MATFTKSIPSTEGKFDAWAKHFVQQVTEHPDAYLLGEERLQHLNAGLAKWDEDYAEALATRDAARAAATTKSETRDKFTHDIRAAVRFIQGNDNVTDAARREAGISVHKTTRTPASVPTTFPIGFVMASDRLEHTLSYADSSTPTRRAKPKGAKGCEVYLFVGDEPSQDPNNYRFLTLSTRTPDRLQFDSKDAGELANYLLRWVNSKGEVGPWSQIISATIPAV